MHLVLAPVVNSGNLPGKESGFGQRSLCCCIQGEELLRNYPGIPEISGEEF